jgi:hypothetical protein
MPSKVAFDPEEPSLGRIRADFIAPPHTRSSILQHISRIESNPAISSFHLYGDVSCDIPLEEGYISILHSECPGLSPDEPMAVVQANDPLLPDRSPIPDGTYFITNRAEPCHIGVDTGRNIYFYGGKGDAYECTQVRFGILFCSLNFTRQFSFQVEHLKWP